MMSKINLAQVLKASLFLYYHLKSASISKIVGTIEVTNTITTAAY